ncbi:LysM peptidoglycan-binding domain-containing protein [Nocardia crassostreae]|uniref:LysM peptidoglycan-binding domain-containing protein n=1 Tax=Nocardia crassostreae TaxID=53428 RepID=UPI0008351583|nr:LysM peptidoglycan-binding domain-containing protein [Nocardia crassostreae]
MARVHTVVAGDTFRGIAQRFYGDGTKFALIAAANGIANTNLIHPGQILQIPDLPGPTPVPTPEPTPPPPETIEFRLLRPADLVDLRCEAIGFRFAPAPQPGVVTHVVVEGDTLWDLAVRFYNDGTKFALIAAANHIADPNLIFPGQVLVIPDVPAPAPDVTHLVVEGDTLWDLAAQFYGDPTLFTLIAAANHLADPNLIFPGQVLIIPAVRPPDPPVERPRLVAVTEDAHIIVRFGSQNLLEQRFKVAPNAPAQVHDSRVVFAVAKGTEFDYSIAGVLTALGAFPLRVSKLALPAREDGVAVPADAPDKPAPPEANQTAIEAPFRLIVSPSPRGGFTHTGTVSAAPGDPARTELWTTRLGVRKVVDGKFTEVDERDDNQRIVRALWTRDDDTGTAATAFTGSLTPMQRRGIVRQTADRRVRDAAGKPIDPLPLGVRRLYLSAVGAWVDWRARWDAESYPEAADTTTLEAYRHLAPMGRDAYVRVETPAFLFPFGHRVTLVNVTERRIAVGDDPVAFLKERTFIVVRERTRTYRDTQGKVLHALPFETVSIDPPVTPDLDFIDVDTAAPALPAIRGKEYLWKVTGIDHAGQPVEMLAPLILVTKKAAAKPTAMQDIRAVWRKELQQIPLNDAEVAMAPPTAKGDTTFKVNALDLDGAHETPKLTSTPAMARAYIAIPALNAINGGREPVEVSYETDYKTKSFQHRAEVFLTLADRQKLDFAKGSDQGGGFIEPSVGVAALSRSMGAIGDSDVAPGSALSQGTFDPTAFLAGALPKLFGLFDLVDIIAKGTGFDQAPNLIAEQLGMIDSLAAEFARLVAVLDKASTDLGGDIANAANAAAGQRLQALRGKVDTARTTLTGAATNLQAALANVLAGQAQGAATEASEFAGKLASIDAVVSDPILPAAVRGALEKPAAALRTISDLAQGAKLLAALQAPTLSDVMRFEWQPEIKDWPEPGPAIFKPDKNGLTIAVEVRTTDRDKPQVDVSAQLRAFELVLMPGAELMSMRFGRLGFRVSTGRKPEIDVVFDKLEFLGPLTFIEKIRQLIPFDGFADPPYVDISTEGVTAGFDLALPSVAVGVFSLENISLAADCRIPFLGEAVTVGFGFCSKESPFRLTVMCIGGGGWVALRLSPAKMVVLEMGLEACASLNVDLGVASGSVSVSIGVYLRLEDKKGQLTGYFRIRGEVDVLGLISASITLELSLTYQFDTGKLVGRASLTVEVEVLFFSASVEITCERQLAGSKGDPAMLDIMPPHAGGQSMWNSYFDSFAIGA